MTSIVDSKAYFKQRAGEISLEERVVNALNTKGVHTLSQVAFCVGQPGQVLPAEEFDKWAITLIADITFGEKASLRRLMLEAQTLLVASLKDIAEHPEGTTSKKVGLAERNARLDKLRNDLTGIDISGELEPSHALLDATMQQWESRTLKYLGPEKCHSREAEVQNLRAPVKSISFEDGKLTVQDDSSLDDREIEGALQVLQALRRRGIAYAFANLISWQAHEKYLDALFRFITKPAQPGYRKVSLRQTLRADKLVFAKLGEDGKDIRAKADGTLPLDKAIAEVLEKYDLIVALLPLPDTDGKGKKGKGKFGGKATSSFPAGAAGGKWGRYQPKGYGKYIRDTKGGKGKSSKGDWLPAPLRYAGASATNKKGNRVCYGWNLGQCSDPNCGKGDHTCIIFSCGGDHPVSQCPLKPKKL